MRAPDITRVYVHKPAYGKPFYGNIIAAMTPHYTDGVCTAHHGNVLPPAIAYLIQRSPTSGALWYTPNDIRALS